MTVDELRKALEGVPGEMYVVISTDNPFGVLPVDPEPTRRADIYGFREESGEDPDQLFFLIS